MNVWQASDLATAEACQVEKGEPPRTVTELALMPSSSSRRENVDAASSCTSEAAVVGGDVDAVTAWWELRGAADGDESHAATTAHMHVVATTTAPACFGTLITTPSAS